MNEKTPQLNNQRRGFLLAEKPVEQGGAWLPYCDRVTWLLNSRKACCDEPVGGVV